MTLAMHHARRGLRKSRDQRMLCGPATFNPLASDVRGSYVLVMVTVSAYRDVRIEIPGMLCRM